MNQVVNFLSLLAVTEEQGGIKRMLGVCVEFERIAKVVLDKAEKESHSRRKRKNNRETEETNQIVNDATPKLITPLTPVSQNQQHSPNTFTQPLSSSQAPQQFDPSFNGFSSGMNNENMPLPLDFTGTLNPTPMQSSVPENDFRQIPGESVSPLNLNSFQQPFVPQDFWQMPQTLEWDWADMSNIGFSNNFPAFDGEVNQSSGLQDGYNGT